MVENGRRKTPLRARDLRLANYMAWTGNRNANDLKVIFNYKVEEPGARQATKAALKARGGSGTLHSQPYADDEDYDEYRDYNTQEITEFIPGGVGWAELMTNNRLLGGFQQSLIDYADIYEGASIQKVYTVVYKGGRLYGSHVDKDGEDSELMFVTYLKR
ncbi:Uu.00g147270.m01.CDS01 [Anthostomella pinea]|uniref:Uu.00g147270.m01.CDS01 n=1 Tax=Anthostomella pinea TaxID=933095 RepID=A0AAI8VRC4_9PEZI|nr:Uu.00g147270.m01.CDS01 [Anthostomella pinea]